MITQVLFNGFVLSATIALMALGFTLLFGILRIVNFAHGMFYTFGAVLVYYFIHGFGVNYILASIVALVAVGAFGWCTEIFVVRSFRGNMMGALLATIALMFGIQELLFIFWGPLQKSVPTVIHGKVLILGSTLSYERIFISAVSIVAIVVLAVFIKYSRLGKAMRAVQQDSEAATTLGINVNRICGITFAIAAALAALSGVLHSPVAAIYPGMGEVPLLLAFIVVILGGLGSITGALLASFIIGFQQSFTATFWLSEFSVTTSFALVMIILLLKPTGLMGHD
jgi:branched-chain amino acid transport system permease protein